MERYTQKALRSLCAYGNAQNITSASETELNKIVEAEKHLLQIGYSAGVYGINGALYQGEQSGQLYAITARAVNLFRFS